MQRSNFCYICGMQLVDVPSGHQGRLNAKHRTRDHIPPQGIFNDPKPSNLITASCCFECNGRHSDFDEQLRVLCSLELGANDGGRKILLDKTIGSTMANARQPGLMKQIFETIREAELGTSNGPRRVAKFTVDWQPIEAGITALTKGLLTNFYPGFNYYNDKFVVLDIHSASLAAGEAEPQQKMIQELETKTLGKTVGNHSEFRYWRKVEVTEQRGAWLLRFYDAVNFVVIHHRISDRFDVAVKAV